MNHDKADFSFCEVNVKKPTVFVIHRCSRLNMNKNSSSSKDNLNPDQLSLTYELNLMY